MMNADKEINRTLKRRKVNVVQRKRKEKKEKQNN